MGLISDFFNCFKAVKESIYDTEVYDDMIDKYGESNTKLSAEDKKKIDTLLALPDIRPYDEEGTLEAWLLRISLWGKIKIIQNCPADNIRNKKLTNQEFLYYIDNQVLNDTYGLWEIDVMAFNKIKYYRSCGNGKTEELIIEIDLRPDLKKILKKVK